MIKGIHTELAIACMSEIEKSDCTAVHFIADTNQLKKTRYYLIDCGYIKPYSIEGENTYRLTNYGYDLLALIRNKKTTLFANSLIAENIPLPTMHDLILRDLRKYYGLS